MSHRDRGLNDDVEVQPLVDWLANEFQKLEKIDLRKDKESMRRLKEAALRAQSELSTSAESTINIQFIASDSSGPKHLLMKLTRTELDQLSGKYDDTSIVRFRAKQSTGNPISRKALLTMALSFLVSAGAFIGGLAVSWHSFDLVMHGLRSKATVVSLDRVEIPGRLAESFPVLAFETRDGQQIKFRSLFLRKFDAPVDVLYSPDKPANVLIDDFVDLWLIPCFLGLFALAFGGSSVFLFLRRGDSTPITWEPKSKATALLSNILAAVFACTILSCFVAALWHILSGH